MFAFGLPWSRVCRDDKGGVTIIFGVSAFVLFMMIGIAIDSSRTFNATSKIQSALDAASLAGAKLLDVEGSTDAEVLEKALAFFESRLLALNISKTDVSNFRVDIDRASGKVEALADVRIQNIMSAATKSFDDTVFTPSSTASYMAKKIELALVVDITGSMCDTPPAMGAPACTSGVKLDALKDAAEDMIDTLYSANPDAGAIKVSVIPYSGSVNAGAYAAAVSGGASTDGCVVERAGFDAYSDASPAAGSMGTSSLAAAPFYSCPPTEMRALTDLSVPSEQQQVRNVIRGLEAIGGTAGHIGLAMGWHTVTPSWNGAWPANPARDYDPGRVIKAVVLMTDGMFNISYANGGENHAWPNPSSKDPYATGSAPNQAMQLCGAMRNPSNASKKIDLYAVTFQSPPEAETFLKECVGEENFYNSDSASQLSESFRSIVNKLTSLRITG